jgi:hypothetical protein
MNPIDWWSLTLIPGLAALGWSFRNALRLKAIERQKLDDRLFKLECLAGIARVRSSPCILAEPHYLRYERSEGGSC